MKITVVIVIQRVQCLVIFRTRHPILKIRLINYMVFKLIIHIIIFEKNLF